MTLIRMTQIFKYSGLQNANTISDYDHKHINNGDKLLIMIFGTEFSDCNKLKHRWHYVRICKVVKEGTIMFKNRNDYWCINIDYLYWLDGKLNKRINDISYLSWSDKIINESLSTSLKNFICDQMIIYTVRIPNDDLLEEIRQFKKKKSLTLFQLAFLAINTNLLHEYNYLIHNYCVGNRRFLPLPPTPSLTLKN